MTSATRAYLDWNATAPLSPAARAAMLEALALPGNASSVHAEGRQARALLERARAEVAALARAAPAQVVFTSGASEAASLVLTPDFRMGRAPLAVTRLYVSASEHPCVLAGGRFPAESVTCIPVDGRGLVDPAALREKLARDGAGASGRPMVAIHWVNNETGVVQPIAEIAACVRAHGGIVVVDAVQGAGRLPMSVDALGADFIILSSHKLGGPKGAGALIAAGAALMPAPLVTGGGQERGHRAGTENLAAIAGFGAAAAEAAGAAPDFAARFGPQRARIEAQMRDAAADVVIHGVGAERVANTVAFALPGLKAETAQIAFDLEGVALSAGSACSSGKVGRSHVLEAMGVDEALGGLRMSFGPRTQTGELERFVDAFRRIDARRKARSGTAAADTKEVA